MDWYPWGEDALARARDEERPILLSIGYSACHWCHVMERESFEDPETAALMNERFVSIKLDREERPDLDSIYMEACQAMTGQGGWPLNVFLDPGAGAVLRRHVLPARLAHGHAELALGARGGGRPPGTSAATRSARGLPHRRAPRAAGRSSGRRDGPRRGRPRRGRGHPEDATTTARTEASAARRSSRRPPRSSSCSRRGESRHDRATRCAAMASGGMYDQVGGGFARYSVDAVLAGPPLREDALRQRAPRARLPARLAGHRRAAVPQRLRGDARLGAPRDARAGGRLLLRARRRLGGRGGAVLRLDRRRAARRARRRAGCRRGDRAGSAPPTAATSRAGTSRSAAPGDPERRGVWRERLYEVRSKRVWPGPRRQAARPPGTR